MGAGICNSCPCPYGLILALDKGRSSLKRSLNLFLAFIACVFVSTSAAAQSRDAVLQLDSQTKAYDIVPNSYLTRDLYGLYLGVMFWIGIKTISVVSDVLPF